MNRAFYAWLAGASLSTFGDAAVFFALGWAATGIAPHVAGLVLTAYTLPRAVLLLAGGVLGDRVGPRRLLLSGYSLLAVATFALALTVHFAGTSTALLLLIAFIIGTVDAFTLPAPFPGCSPAMPSSPRPSASPAQTQYSARCPPRLRHCNDARGRPPPTRLPPQTAKPRRAGGFTNSHSVNGSAVTRSLPDQLVEDDG